MLNLIPKTALALISLLKGNKGSDRKFDRLLQIKNDGSALATDGYVLAKYYKKPVDNIEEIEPLQYGIIRHDIQEYNQNYEICIDDLSKIKFSNKIETPDGDRLETLEDNFIMKDAGDVVEMRTYADTGLKGMIVVPKEQEIELFGNFPESIHDKFAKYSELDNSPFIGVEVGNLLNVLETLKRMFSGGEKVTLHIVSRDGRKFLMVRAGRENENFEAVVTTLANETAIKEERAEVYTDYVNF